MLLASIHFEEREREKDEEKRGKIIIKMKITLLNYQQQSMKMMSVEGNGVYFNKES